jgi:hypothetical protein
MHLFKNSTAENRMEFNSSHVRLLLRYSDGKKYYKHSDGVAHFQGPEGSYRIDMCFMSQMYNEKIVCVRPHIYFKNYWTKFG